MTNRGDPNQLDSEEAKRFGLTYFAKARRQLNWINTACKGKVCSNLAGLGLKFYSEEDYIKQDEYS